MTGGDQGRRVGVALCLVSAAGFGSLAVFGKQAYAGGLGVVEVLARRFGIAGPLPVALVLASFGFALLRHRSRARCVVSVRSSASRSRT